MTELADKIHRIVYLANKLNFDCDLEFLIKETGQTEEAINEAIAELMGLQMSKTIDNGYSVR